MRPLILGAVLFLSTLLSFTAFSQAPEPTALSMSGVMKLNHTLTVNFTYFDPQGGAQPQNAVQYRWNTYDDVFDVTPTQVATTATLTPVNFAAFVGKQISVEVRVSNAVDGFGPWIEFKPWTTGVPSTSNPVLTAAAGNCNVASGGASIGSSNGFVSLGNVCSPRTITWFYEYTGINYNKNLNQYPVIVVDWGDGTVEIHLATIKDATETKMSRQTWRIQVSHTYDYGNGSNPPTDGSCTYAFTSNYGLAPSTVAINTVPTTLPFYCTGIPQTQEMSVWDKEDNADLGTFDINHDNTTTGNEVGELVEVCKDDNGIIRLNDDTDFNCTPPAENEVSSQNTNGRWIQWVYGSTSNITTGAAANEKIYVNSVPYNSTDLPVYGALQFITGPLTGTSPGITDDIRMPVSALVNQEFVVTLRSWNICNPLDAINLAGTSPDQSAPVLAAFPNKYDVSRNRLGVGTNQPGLTGLFAHDTPVTIDYTIHISGKPVPPTAVNQSVCKGTTPGAFSLTGVPVGATTNWYRNNNGVAGAFIQSSATLPIADYAATTTDSLQTNAFGYYKVWASYTPATAGLNCETDKVPVTIIIRMKPPTPAEILGPTDVCADGTTVYAFSLTGTPDSPTSTPTSPPTPASQLTTVGGATVYNWSFTVPGNIDITPPPAGVGPSGTTNKDFGAVFGTAIFGAGNTTTRTLQVNSNYSSGTTCASNNEADVINVFKVSNGGTLSTNPASTDICSGGTKDFEVTGVLGTIQAWQFSTDGGATWGTDTDFGIATNPASKVFTNATTAPITYIYQVAVKHGACAVVTSNQLSFTVYPVPPKPAITANPDPATICADGSTVTLTSSNLGGIGSIYRWFKTTDMVTPVQATASNQLVLATVAQSGNYVVALRGVTPTFCNSVSSDPVTVTIKPLPTVSTVTGGGAVCGGSPAPDIIFTFTGTQPFDFTIDRPGALSDIVVTGHASNTYVLSNQTGAGNYQISLLADASTCSASSLGGFASVTIGGTAVNFNTVSLTNSAVCDDGTSTVDPIVAIDLDGGVVAGYNLFYTINGGSLLSKSFNTDASGDANVNFDYVTDFGGSPTPNPHTLRIESVVTPAGCLTSIAQNLSYRVNLRPSDPINPVNAIACSSAGTGSTISVDAPPVGSIVLWFDNVSLTPPVATGLVGGTRQNTFTPTSNATLTYYAVIESTTGPTNCRSDNAIAVQHTQDISPTTPNAGPATDQTCATNYTLNANTISNGTGYWSTSGLLYAENFAGVANGVTSDNGIFGWSRDIIATPLLAGDYFEVRGERFSSEDLGAGATNAIWRSSTINVSSITAIDISVDLFKNGQLEITDFIEAYYVMDGTPTKFGEISRGINDGSSTPVNTTATAININVSSNTNLVIEIRMRSGENLEIQEFDNLIVRENSSSPVTFDNIFDPLTIARNLQVGANTLVWNAQSTLGVCLPTPDNIIVTRIALPVGLDDSDDVCFGTPTVNLPSYDLLVGGGVNKTVTWFTDASRSSAVGTPGAATYTAGQIFYALITETSSGSGCTNLVPGPGSITINVLPLPVANNQTPAVCEEIDPGTGFGTGSSDDIDLTSLNNTITGGAASRTITWYADPMVPVNDPSDLTTLVTSDIDVDGVVNGRNFYALVENTLTGCLNIARITYTIKSVPDPQSIIGNDPTCASSTPQLYTLTTLTTADSYIWDYPANISGVYNRFGGGNNGDGFLLLQFPSLSSPPTADNYLIRVAEVKNGCQGIFNEKPITVEGSPSPNAIVNPGLICKNEDGVTIGVTSPNINNNYSWSILSSPTEASIVGASAGPGLSSVLVDFGTDNAITLRVQEVSSSGCNGTAQFITINTNDQPVMTSLTTAEICSNELIENVHVLTANVTPFSPPNTPLSFDWQIGSITPAGSVSGTGIVVGNSGSTDEFGEIGHAPLNVSGIIGTVVYNVTPVSDAGCRGTTVPLTLTVHPKPVMLAGQTKTICSGDDADYEIRLSPPNAPASTLFDWADPDATGTASDGVDVALGASGTLHITDNLVNTGSTGPINIVYSVTPSNFVSVTKSCVGTSQNVTIIVNPEPVANDPTPLSNICSDGNVNYLLQNSITNSVNSTFEWIAADNANVTGESLSTKTPSTINDILINVSSLGNQLISYSVTPRGNVAAGLCFGDPFTVNITVEAKPVGTTFTLPAAICSTTTTPLGFSLQSKISNSVASNFEWQAVSNSGVTGESLAPVVDPSITDMLRNTVAATTVIYNVTPKAQAGLQCPGASFVINVPVNPEPVGADLPLTSFCSGGNVNYVLQPNITNAVLSTFEWSVLSAGTITGQSGTPQSNGTIDDDLRNLSGTNQSITYKVIPKSTANCVGEDFEISMTVLSEPVGFDETVATICSDGNPAYDLQTNNIDNITHVPPGNNQPSTFSWHPTVNNPNVTGDENLGNRTTAVIGETLINVTTLVPENVIYEVIPTGSNNCVGESFLITVPVGPKPVGTPVLAPSEIMCSQATFSQDLQANINLTNSILCDFEWHADPDADVDNEITANTFTDNISNMLINRSSGNRTITYRVTPTSTAGGCDGDQFNIQVVVKNEPVGWNDATFPAICSNTDDVGYVLQNNLNTAPGNSLGSDFVWRVLAPDDNINISGQSTTNKTAATIDDDLVNISNTDQSIVYTVSPKGKTPNLCDGADFKVTVTVRPEPHRATPASPAAECSDVAHAINLQSLLSNNLVASTFEWNAVADSPTVTGESLSVQGPNTVINDAIKNENNNTVVIPYTVTPTSIIGSCEGSRFTVNVSTKPEPKGSDDSKIICSGDAVGYQALQSNINGNNGLSSSFTWRALTDVTDITGESTSTQTPGTITDGPLTNISNPAIPLDVIYRVTPVAAGCIGDDFDITVTVNPRPQITVGSEAVICSGLPFSIALQSKVSNGLATSFSWNASYSGVLTGGLLSGGNTISETLSNLGGIQESATYTVIPTNAAATQCVGSQFVVVKPINPQPVTDPSLATKTICSDAVTGILLNTNGISIGANTWDVDRTIVSSNLIASGSNAVDPGFSQGASYIQNDTYNNVTFTPGTVEYLVTPIGPASTFCRGVQTLVRITVNGEPVMNPALTANTIVCSDEKIDIVLSTNGSSVAAQSYIFKDLQNPPGTPVAVTGTNAIPNAVETGAGDRLPTVFQNDRYNNISPTGASLTRTYIVKPKSSANCLGDAIQIPVQVLPEPDFTFSAAPPVCSDEQIDLLLSQAGATPVDHYLISGINWDVLPGTPVLGLLPGGSNLSTNNTVAGPNFTVVDKYTNGTNQQLKAYYKVIPFAVTVSGKQCVGDEETAFVEIKPSPVVLGNLDKIICNDAVNGITIGTESSSASAQSFEIIRNPLPGTLTPGVYTPGTQVINGASTNTIALDHVVNSTDNTQVATYTIRANTDLAGVGCYGPPETITVTVEPQIRVLVSSALLKDNICSTKDTEINLTSPSLPSAGIITFNFTATAATPGTISGLSSGSNLDGNLPIAQTLSNSSNLPVDVTYNVTPRANSAAGGIGCPGTPSSTVVKVEPKPKMTASPASLTVCEGIPLGIDFASVTTPSPGAASMFFELIAVVDPNTSGPPPNVTGYGTPASYPAGADVLNDILVNNAVGQEPIRYSFIPSFTIPSTSETCKGEPVSINVTVSPRPVMTPFTIDPKCSAETFLVDFSSHVTEVDLSSTLSTWTFSPASTSELSGASNGAGFELSQVIFNKKASSAIVTYSIKSKAFNCESNTIQVPVEVFPIPKITGVPSTVNVCNNGTMSVALNSTANNTQYTWVVDNESQPTLTGALDQAAPVNGPISYLLANTGTSLGNYTFEITPQLNTSLAGKVCVGDAATMVANVAPPIDGRITTSNGTDESFLCTGSREFLFLEFDGLPLFDVVYKEGSNTITLTKQGGFKPIQITPSATTIYELVSVKDAFGCSVAINKTATVNVDNTDATFSIAGHAESCSPYKVSFEYDQQAGVNYTWKWFDGPDSIMYSAVTDELDKIVKHTFENPSPLGVAKFKVYLETELTDTRYSGCLKTSFHEVRVSPKIGLGVFPDVTAICSGETVAFTNTSQGVSTHRWFYREVGSTQEIDVRGAISPSYQLINNTTQNPITYEVVYQADNGKCPTSTITPITVYRGVDAAFDEGTVPPYVAGSSTVTYTNTSSPISGTDFSYEWTFGTNATPDDHSGTDLSIPVTYNLPGLKEVVLIATNKVAAAAGLSCSDKFAKTIEILLPPLVAAFQAAPLAACFPTNVEITENTSTGDVYKWQVIDQSGNIAATALSPKPIFRIVNPGTYDIFLESSSSITGQVAFAQKLGIEIYDNPLASLEARPTTLFIPDTELITFNFSTGANFYNWDFDDGTVSEDFEPKHFYTLEGQYLITLVAGFDHGDKDIDGDGITDGKIICYDTAQRALTAREGGLTKVPNAFTPSKNGPNGGISGNGTFNDVFLPITKGVAREDGSFIMQIFDRWGTLVYESRNQTQGWDGYDRNGNLVPAGVYVFKLDLRLADGQRTTQVGDVTVIR